MSTTVSYKGSTIATVDNSTKTLKTAGKYLEGDVVLTDVTSGGGDSWSWMGKNPTLVITPWTETLTFEDLGVDSWTWSTSYSTLRGSQTYSPSITFYFEDYDYHVIKNIYVYYDYGDWAPKAAPISYGGSLGINCFGNNTSVSSIETGVPNSNSAIYYGPGSPLIYYCNGTGNTVTNTNVYGVIPNFNIYTDVTNPGTASPTYTFSSGIINIRGNNSYFSSNAFSYLDVAKSYCKISHEIWRVDRGTSAGSRHIINSVDIVNNGL